MWKWFKNLFKKEPNKEYMREMAQIVEKYVDFFSSIHGRTESFVTKWGAWIKVAEGDSYKAKVILIERDQRFSLQFHDNRDEFWVIVSGTGKVTIENETYDAKPGDRFYIPAGMKHRAQCTSDYDFRFVEIQFGKCDEKDITRLEDDYGRV